MSSRDLVRWSGLAALIGGVLIIFADGLSLILFPGEESAQMMTTSSWFIIQVLSLLGLMFITISLPGMYARQAQEAGTLGLVSFVIAFSGMLMTFGLLWGEPFLGPYLVQAAPDVLVGEPSGVLLIGVVLALALFAAGWLLFGVASLRAKVLPRGAAILLIIGAVLFFVSQFLDLPFWSLLLGAALAWIGYDLWRSTYAEPAPSPEAAT
jgi:hypothetical protein